jgi:hypothetical protein
MTDRINPWENPEKREALMRGIRIAAKKRRKWCPRPVNSRPPGPLPAADCIADGECGCDFNVWLMLVD